MTQPNPIGLSIVLPAAIFLAGLFAGCWLAVWLHMRGHKPSENESVETRPSGIESYWMENGDRA